MHMQFSTYDHTLLSNLVITSSISNYFRQSWTLVDNNKLVNPNLVKHRRKHIRIQDTINLNHH